MALAQQSFKVKGMHCASCAGIIQKTLGKMEGVASAAVNYANESASLSFDTDKISAETLAKKIEPMGYTLVVPKKESHAHHGEANQSKQEKLAEIASLKAKVIGVMPLAAISIFIMGWELLISGGYLAAMPPVWKEFFHHLLAVMATYALFVTGQPYLKGLASFLRTGQAEMNALIGLGTSAAYLYSFIITAFEDSLIKYVNVEHTYYDVVIVVIAFITLGKFLEAHARLKTGDAVEKLIGLQAKTALVRRSGKEIEIPAGEVMVGDLLIIKPGARIPVDGAIAEGHSFIDESMVSGEPAPVEKKEGDSVIGSTLNTTGSFILKASRVGAETVLAGIIRMVEAAQGSKAPIQALADKISAVFVPMVLVLSFVSLGVWLIFGIPALGLQQALSFALTSFVGILVIACPCALGLATPTAIIVGVGKGAREGILVKDAATLEKLWRVNTVVVDKTGTLTQGKPELAGIKNFSGKSDDELLALLAALESKSEHPIAAAITRAAETRGVKTMPVEGFEAVKGKGLKGCIGGAQYFAGNPRYMGDIGISFDAKSLETEAGKGRTSVLLAAPGKILAFVTVADTVKPGAASAVTDLKKMGVDVIMLTGDNAGAARHVAGEVGIETFFAGMLPEEKLEKIKELQSEGRIVAMAGDGVNDAPALAQADVGIAMATGTDVAIEAAGITLLHGDIAKLVKALRLARLVMAGIKQNLFWAFIFNLAGIPLAGGAFYPFTGWLLSPVFAGLAMAFSSVAVVSNSLRLKLKRL